MSIELKFIYLLNYIDNLHFIVFLVVLDRFLDFFCKWIKELLNYQKKTENEMEMEKTRWCKKLTNCKIGPCYNSLNSEFGILCGDE